MAKFWKFFKRKKQETYLALDIGTESVKALIFRPNVKQECLEILGIGRRAPPQVGLLNIEGLLLQAEEAIKRAQGRAPNQSKLGTGQAKTTPSKVILGFGGEFIKGKTSEYTFKRANPEEKISPTELKNLIQKAEWKIFDEIKSSIGNLYNSQSSGIKLIDAEIEEILIDGDKVDNPFNFSGKSVSLKIFNSFCSRSTLEGLEKFSYVLNLENLVLTSTSHATAKTIMAQKRNLEAILIDVGGSSTEVSIIREGAIWENFTFDIGAKGFTNYLSRALGVGRLQAEQIKLGYSENKVSPRVRESIGKILEGGFKLWIAGISLGLGQQSWSKLPRQILLFGGGSLLPGVQRVFGDSRWKENLPFLKNPVVKIIYPEDFKRVINLSGQVLSPRDTSTLALAAFFADLQRRKQNLSKILHQAVRVVEG